MPRKERLKKRRYKELQALACGNTTLSKWFLARNKGQDLDDHKWMEDREEDLDESQHLEVQTSKEEVGEHNSWTETERGTDKEEKKKTETVLSKEEDALDCKWNNQTDGQEAERMETQIIEEKNVSKFCELGDKEDILKGVGAQ